MVEIEITGIRKDHGNHYDPHEAIEAYRWIQHSTDKSDITAREVVVQWLDKGINGVNVVAYVQQESPRADCTVKQSQSGTRFLQTNADATSRNNLLRLPEC